MVAQRDTELGHSCEKEIQHVQVGVWARGKQSLERTSPRVGYGILVHIEAARDCRGSTEWHGLAVAQS